MCAWIRTVDPEDAEGPLARVYHATKRRYGFVPNVRRALSLNPGALRAYLQLSGEVYAGGPLPAVEREMIAVVVSAINECHY